MTAAHKRRLADLEGDTAGTVPTTWGGLLMLLGLTPDPSVPVVREAINDYRRHLDFYLPDQPPESYPDEVKRLRAAGYDVTPAGLMRALDQAEVRAGRVDDPHALDAFLPPHREEGG